MKNAIYFLITLSTIISTLPSCSSNKDKKPEFEEFENLDFGKGTYRPNPFKFCDNIPPFSWMGMPDSVKKETTLEISFNEDAIRSNSTGEIAFVDINGRTVDGISYNGKVAKSYSTPAGAEGKVIRISYTVNPEVGDSILQGYIVASGVDIDEANGQSVENLTPFAKWELNHEIGINWWRWIILILIVAIILSIIGVIIYGIVVGISEAAPAISSIPSISPTSFGRSFTNPKKSSYNAQKMKEEEEEEFRGYARLIAPNTYQINKSYIIPSGRHHKNPQRKTCGQLLSELGDSTGIIKIMPNGEPLFDKDGGTNTGMPLEASFPEGIEKYLKKDQLIRGKNVTRTKLHIEAFRRIAKKYNMDERMLQVFKGNADSDIIKSLRNQWGCSEQEVFNRCGNPYRIARVLHECKDCKTVKLVPWVYHHLSHYGGIEALKSAYAQ